ncbi:MAG: hypothetical protein IKI10_09770 [Muribaculaceae bacterium]|nr:hypothetical protein [Muribaculaceae bacterium]
MKKIYMILAALTLLSMSLNAQNSQTKATASTKGQPTGEISQFKGFSFNDMVRGIKGMSSILPECNPNGNSSSGPMRAPLMINSDEYTVGPFEGSNFDDDGGLGFGALYPQNQDIRVATILDRSEFAQHAGDQIVGFRFALAGQTSTNNQVKVYDFISWPVGTNGYFENANLHTWNLGDFGDGVSTDYQLINDDLTSTNFSTGTITTSAPWTATSVNNQSNGSFYILSGGNLKFTVPSGYSNADFKFTLSTRASYFAGTFTFTPSSGSAVTLTTSAANTVYECELTGLSTGDVVTITGRYGSASYSPDFTYMHVYAKGGEANYLTLTGGQWYEYYLDDPIDFVVNDSINELWLGYTYQQYPSSSTNELRFPMGINPASTTHDHAAWLYYPQTSSSGIKITVPGNTVNFKSISVYDTSNNLLTSWNSSSTNTGTVSNSSGGTSTYYILPTGWSVDGAYLFQYGSSGNYVGYVSTSSSCDILISSDILGSNSAVNVVIAAYDDNGNVTMSVNDQGKTISNSTSGTYTWNNVSLSSTTYDYGLYGFDFSQYGDLAVQLIFKTTGPKLITPEDGSTVDVGTNTGSGTSTTVNVSGSNLTQDLTVSVSGTGFSVTPTTTISAADANAGTSITVSYNGTDPNATGTLTISSGEVTTTVTLTATCEFTPELTAPANGSTVDVGTNTGSGTSTTVTVSGSYLTQDLSVSVSGDGFTVSPTIISAADANAGTTITVTYNGTDPDATGTLTISSGEVTTTVDLSATYSESEPAFSTNGIIRMGNLIIVDQFWASTAENTHPEQYSYILRYTPAQGDPKESSPKTVDVEHVKSVVNGYYTEEDVKNDSITYNTVIVNKMTADVEMTLPNNDNKIYYVRLQGKDNDVPSEADKVNDNSDMIVKLQMTSGDGGFYYIDQIPTSHPQYTPGQVNHFMDPAEPGTGSSYGDFKSYVPSVMTYGQSRRYFANDTLHNTYGAPVWRTGIGDVTIQNGMKVERQSNQWGTTQWEANGQACSLYILDNILAYGKLPNKQNSNVDYEPYMFRVFVESPSGKLRGYTPQNVYSPEKPDSIIGTELVADNSFTNFTGPICIYSEYFDGASHIDTVADATNGDYFQFTLNKNSDNWVDNAMFGGLDDIIQGEGDDLSLSDNDLKVYVRFYYRSKGSINPSHVIRGRDASLPHMYYGAEAESPTPDPWTSVTEVRSHGEIIGVTYVNAQGMTSNKPFDGLNIVVTRYSDGSTTTTKVVR